MPLVDISFFKHEIAVAQLSQQGVQENLNWFINEYEPLFLQEALGYDLFAAFVLGLQEDPIAQRWLDLRDGIEFTNLSGYKRKWIGFANSASYTINNGVPPEIVFVTDNPGAPSSVDPANVFTTSVLAGLTYWIERRGFGMMIQGTDVSITNNGQTWTLLFPGDKFQHEEIFIAHITRGNGSSVVGFGNGFSPIAGYVYYHYMRNQATLTAGVSEVKPKTENSLPVSNETKMAYVWNRVWTNLCILREFLYYSQSNGRNVYPEWKYEYMCNLRPINVLGF